MIITKKQETRLRLATVLFILFLAIYNIYFGPTPNAPLWGKLLFPVLQGLTFYFFMRWVMKRYGHEKEPESRDEL